MDKAAEALDDTLEEDFDLLKEVHGSTSGASKRPGDTPEETPPEKRPRAEGQSTEPEEQQEQKTPGTPSEDSDIHEEAGAETPGGTPATTERPSRQRHDSSDLIWTLRLYRDKEETGRETQRYLGLWVFKDTGE